MSSTGLSARELRVIIQALRDSIRNYPGLTDNQRAEKTGLTNKLEREVPRAIMREADEEKRAESFKGFVRSVLSDRPSD